MYVNHHQNSMEVYLVCPLLPLTLRSLAGDIWRCETSTNVANVHRLFPCPTQWHIFSLILLDLAAASDIPFTAPSQNSVCLASLVLHSSFSLGMPSLPPLWLVHLHSDVKCWFKDQVQAFFLPLLFSKQVHASASFQSTFYIPMASKLESPAQTSTLSTHIPLDLSVVPQTLISMTRFMVTHKHAQNWDLCYVPYFGKWHHHWDINQNLGIVLDTCLFLESPTPFCHQALLISTSYMFLNPSISSHL